MLRSAIFTLTRCKSIHTCRSSFGCHEVQLNSSQNLQVSNLKSFHLLTPCQLRIASKSITSINNAIMMQRKHFCTEGNELPVLTLYTKNPCPLCEEALEVLSPYLHKVVLRTVDIEDPENKQWWDEYKYEIPVFHFNGKFLMKHRANVDVFLNAVHNITNSSK